MKIVILDKEEGLNLGGIEVYNQRLKAQLKLAGHTVATLRFAKNRPRENSVYHIPYYVAEARSFIFVPSEKTFTIIRGYLKKLRPELVYMNIGISPLDFFMPNICHELGMPIFGVWHEDFNPALSLIQFFAKSVFLAYTPFCKQLDGLHVFSNNLKSFYVSHGVAANRIFVLPNGVDQTFYTPGASNFKNRHQFKTGILFLGRITTVKNPEILIKTYLNLNPDRSTKLLMVGCGEQEDFLRDRYSDDRILFTGLVKDEKLKRDIIRACQIFVLPSSIEGMSLALLEAMACGLACIASDAGANSELLKGIGITLSHTRLSAQLPLALKLCLEQPELVKLLGSKARDKVQHEYTQTAIFSKLLDLFQKTIVDYHRQAPQVQPQQLLDQTLTQLWKKFKKIYLSIYEE